MKKRITLDVLMLKAIRDDNGCLVLNHRNNKKGYPTCINDKTKHTRVHRYVYEKLTGVTLEPFQFVCHICNNRKCIELSHLYIGNNSDNMKDAYRSGTVRDGLKTYWNKAKSRTHCNNGHAWIEGNIGYHKGYRRCLACHRERRK